LEVGQYGYLKIKHGLHIISTHIFTNFYKDWMKTLVRCLKVQVHV